MDHKILIGIIFLLVFAPQVSAYTLMSEYNIDNQTGGAAGISQMDFKDSANWTAFTKLNWIGFCDPKTATFENDFTAVGAFSGGLVNVSYKISHPVKPDYDNVCEIDLFFVNKTSYPGDSTAFTITHPNGTAMFPNAGIYVRSYWHIDETILPFVRFRSPGVAAGHFKLYTGTGMEAPIAGFTGSPLSGAAPQMITLTDSSTGPATTWNWSGSGPGDLFFSSLTTQNTTVYLMTAGNYTISHGAENALGSDIETKTDYIYIYDDNSTSSTGCLAVNGATGIRIAGAQVDMYDIENTSWTNTTTTEGLGLITTMKGHTIDCYGSAVGFDPGDLLAQPEKHLGFYTLNLWPSVGYKNVSAGYVTLYITVTDISTGNPIAGATVSGGGKNYGVLLNSSAFSLTTNEQGMASVPVPNGTFIYMTAYKSGYSAQTAAVDTGTGSGGDAKVTYWFKMSKATTGPTAAITTLPGGGYPTTSPTVDPAGTPDPSGKGGGEYSTAKGQQMMDYLAQNGMDLVQLCFIVTILALVGVKFGK